LAALSPVVSASPPLTAPQNQKKQTQTTHVGFSKSYPSSFFSSASERFPCPNFFNSIRFPNGFTIPPPPRLSPPPLVSPFGAVFLLSVFSFQVVARAPSSFLPVSSRVCSFLKTALRRVVPTPRQQSDCLPFAPDCSPFMPACVVASQHRPAEFDAFPCVCFDGTPKAHCPFLCSPTNPQPFVFWCLEGFPSFPSSFYHDNWPH